MKEVRAFKSNSGDLYNTEKEAKVKDIVDEITDFMNDKKEIGIYDMLGSYRRVVIEELSKKIVANADKFRKIFDKVS